MTINFYLITRPTQLHQKCDIDELWWKDEAKNITCTKRLRQTGQSGDIRGKKVVPEFNSSLRLDDIGE
jgi:hypothetical protein